MKKNHIIPIHLRFTLIQFDTKYIRKDNDIKIYEWLKEAGNPYTAIGLDDDGSASINWGVYGLPETFIVNNQGKIIYKQIGPITNNELKKINNILK